MKNLPKIALGTWSWGPGFAGSDQVFGNSLDLEQLKPVFDTAIKMDSIFSTPPWFTAWVRQKKL